MEAVEQYYEEVELPSGGVFYSNIPDKLHLRPMTGYEQDILTTERLVKSGKALDMVLSNCLKEKIDLNELLVVDHAYLLFKLREISYGEIYPVKIKCPDCGKENEVEINLAEALSNVKEPDILSEPFEVELPSKGKAVCVFPRVKHIREVEKLSKTKGVEALPNFVERNTTALLSQLITELYLPYVKDELPKQEKIRRMFAKDIAYLRKFINTKGAVFKPEFSFACEFCGYESMMDIPIQANFFFPDVE
ncbi:MAG: hypothetical protein NZ527_01880 [Hydrogenobacter thermophilus]|nr:hypothetical protein [Hydrogenobacter thermophilus]